MTTDELLSSLRDARASIEKHDPDRGREDWGGARSDLAAVRESLDACSAGLDDVLDDLKDEDDRKRLRVLLAESHGDAAALFAASGDAGTARQLMRRAVELAPADGDLSREVRAATVDLDRFADLVHGRRLWGRGERDRARRLLEEVAAGGGDLAGLARETLDGPEPMTGGAPTLFTWNGIGLTLAGRRDARGDGSYIATHCFSVLWIPLFPLAAYRVIDAGDSRYFFLAREKLSGVARKARLLVPLLAVLAAAGVSVGVYYGSTARRIAQDTEAAAGLERAGKADEALAAYDRLLADHAGGDSRSELRPAAAGIMRLTVARVAEPVSAASVDSIRRVVLRYQGLHEELRGPPASEILHGKLVAWADQIGLADLPARRASLRVLQLAAEATVAGVATEARMDVERSQLAAALAVDRPIEALRHYAAVRDKVAVIEPMAAILSTFEPGSSLWGEAAGAVESWLEAAPGGHSSADGFRARLREVLERERDEDRAKVLASNDIAALAAGVAAHPHDHGFAVALALAQRDGGKLDEAVATLTALGAPGRMTAEAQSALGSVYADAGKLELAERVLADLINADLAAFQDAVTRYDSATREAEAAIIERAQRGDFPAHVESEARLASPEKQQEIVMAWMRAELEKDSRLISLAQDAASRSYVVSAALSLGMVRLRMAKDTTGKARDQLLARAEAAFLSVRSQAEGRPDFHMGLGQVYFRLGKPQDGERELTRVLAESDPRLHVAVGQIYRDLGMNKQAIEVAEKVWNGTSDAAIKGEVAILRSLLASDLDEEETWLARADQSQPFVRRGLMSVRGARKLREGEAAAADELYAAVADEYGAEAARDGASANNAAIAEGRRYACTGDVRRLEKSASYLAQAHRLHPESAIVAGNLAAAWQHLAISRVLSTWFDLRLLRPGHPEALRLLAVMADGPERSTVRERLTSDAAFRRSNAILRQWQILAPQHKEAYATEQAILEMLDDERGLMALRERVGSVAMNPSAEREKWMSGARDEVTRKELVIARTHYDRLLDATGSDRRARAAALLWKADALQAEAVLGHAASAYAERERLLAEAVSLFPVAGLERALAAARMDVAMMGAVTASADARAVWDARKRSHGWTIMMHAIIEASAPARDALRGQPQLAASKPVLERTLADGGGLRVWILAHALGDAELEKRAAAAMRASTSLVRAEIDARLTPESTADADTLALVKKIVGP